MSHEFKRIEEFVGWAYRRFELDGASLERVVAEAATSFGADGRFIQEFVFDAWRFFAIEAMTGHQPRAVPVPPLPHEQVDVAVEIDEHQGNERGRLTAARRRRLVDLVRSDETPWVRWMERHPENGVPMRLLNMTKEQLLAAATVRDHESAEARRRAALCRRVAEQLAPGQRAREVMTEQDLERIDEELEPKPTPTPIRALA